MYCIVLKMLILVWLKYKKKVIKIKKNTVNKIGYQVESNLTLLAMVSGVFRGVFWGL